MGGSFFGTLNQTSLLKVELNAEEFGRDIMKEFTGGDKSAFEKGLGKLFLGGQASFEGLEFFSYQDFLPQEDGGVIVVAERQYEGPAGGNDYNCTDEILVASFGGDGRLQWLSAIPKKQALASLFRSYDVHQGMDGVYFIFNDHPDNLERRRANEDVKSQGARISDSNAIIAARISKNGKVSYQRLGDLESNNKWMPTSYGLSPNKENLLTLTLWQMGRKYSFTQYKFP